MEIGNFKIDLNGLALLVTALTAALTAWKGFKVKRKKDKEKDAHANNQRDD
jgi:hypothetical protein